MEVKTIKETIKEKKIRIYIIAGLVILSLLLLGFFVFQIKKAEKIKQPVEKEKTLEEIIQNLTAPEGELPQVPKEVIENLTAPEKKQSSEVPKEVIQGLTAPENK